MVPYGSEDGFDAKLMIHPDGPIMTPSCYSRILPSVAVFRPQRWLMNLIDGRVLGMSAMLLT